MQPTKLLGKPVATAIEEEIRSHMGHFSRPPEMTAVLVGNNSASETYVRLKKKKAQELGIKCHIKQLPESTTEEELIGVLGTLNADKGIHGYIVQLPLPAHIRRHTVIHAIAPEKDLDGFTATNNGALFLEHAPETFLPPATAHAVMSMLDYYHVPLEGKHVAVFGQSLIVGKPIALFLLKRKATVSIITEHTPNPWKLSKRADVIISATGQGHLITPKFVKKGAILMDVGFSVHKGVVRGDISPSCYKKSGGYAPVPGGVGPVTIACLLRNLLKAASFSSSLSSL